jgi:hypothetical protein
MGMAYYPTQSVETILVGQVPITSASFLLLSIGGVLYPNGYRVDYDKGYRLFTPTLDSNGNVAIVCISMAYGQDLPSFALNNVEVFLIV